MPKWQRQDLQIQAPLILQQTLNALTAFQLFYDQKRPIFVLEFSSLSRRLPARPISDSEIFP